LKQHAARYNNEDTGLLFELFTVGTKNKLKYFKISTIISLQYIITGYLYLLLIRQNIPPSFRLRRTAVQVANSSCHGRDFRQPSKNVSTVVKYPRCPANTVYINIKFHLTTQLLYIDLPVFNTSLFYATHIMLITCNKQLIKFYAALFDISP